MSVTFRNVDNFDQLSRQDAERIIYDELVPLLERKKIKLSQYGNHNAQGTLTPVDDYQTRK